MEQAYKRYYGKNYKEVIKKMQLEKKKLRSEFLKKYPNADKKRFIFNVPFNQDGSVGNKTIFFQDPNEKISSFDITSDTFKNNPDWTQYLYWPREWRVKDSDKHSPSQFKTLKENNMDPDTLLIFVTEKKKFTVQVDPIDTKYLNDPSDNVRTEPFDYINNPYFTAIAASYVSTYLCGISVQHLTNAIKRTPSNIVTSIAQYHYAYQVRKFLLHPEKLKKYLTKDDIKLLQQHIPVEEKWETKYSSSGAKLNLFKQELENSGKRVRNLKFVLHGNMGVSTTYEEFIWSHGKSKDDYKLFIPKFATGITKIGQKLFQQSIESYVYCVLGAQARTRWSIVDQGAKSLQTQEVFAKLTNDTTAQDDITVSISNMRKAIKSTNVILNFAISPGLILIPSDMRIIMKPLNGFNNVLTLASKEMSFGGNKDVNKFNKPVKHVPRLEYPETETTSEPVLPLVFGVSLAGMFLVFRLFQFF